MILNGLGRTKYEELFVVWGTAAKLLREAGYTVVSPEVERVGDQPRHGRLFTDAHVAGRGESSNRSGPRPRTLRHFGAEHSVWQHDRGTVVLPLPCKRRPV